MKKTPDEIQELLKEVCDHYDKEDRSIRERQIRQWRQLKFLWNGIYRTWYSEVAHDWRIWDEETADQSDVDQSYYDKPINVFRAYLESIIAALSIIVPPVKCYPDDAENTLDIQTARAGDKIASLIYRHNNVSLLWLHALFIYCTEGLVGCYSYSKSDKKYGTYTEQQTENTTEEHEYTTCPNCGNIFDDVQLTPEDIILREKLKLENDKFAPGNEDVELQNVINDDGFDLCPACMQVVAPLISRETLVITRIVGETEEPKSRVCLEAYGGLYLKVPNYAKDQAACPYLKFSRELNYASVIEQYEHLHGHKDLKDFSNKVRANTGPHDFYEFWGRLSPEYLGEYPLNVVTLNSWWLRPESFNCLSDVQDVKRLKKLYPNGCKVVYVCDQFAEACNENLDDAWTLTFNPLSDYIHFDPLGLLLVSVQEITNDLISLTLQTIEHGIPQTFADPGVLNFDAYNQSSAIPGGIYEATPKSGKSVGDAFYEVKTATLSQEVMPFSSNIQSLAQLVSGALPSLFGGQLEGSETASQYSMSRAQAQQRLQTTWKMFTSWWKEIFGKAVPIFIKEMKDDEKDVQMNKDKDFFNVFIRKAETEGKIGKIELEANENLPMTWAQKKDQVMQLMTGTNQQLLALLTAPENLPMVKEAIGLPDLYVPGEDDVEKQYEEIKLLLNSEPIMMPPDEMQIMEGQQMGVPPQPVELPSIEIDPDYDNHQVQFEICRKWIISEAGRQAKVENEPGYKNVLLHGLAHKQVLMQQQMEAQMQAQEQEKQLEKPKETDQEVPIQGEQNVPTIQ